MYWYLREESPMKLLEEIAIIDMEKGLERISGKRRLKIARRVLAIKRARGRNLYEPSKKLLRWFLMPYFIKGICGGNRAGKTSSCVIDMLMQLEGWHPLQRENLEVLAKDARDEWVRELCGRILKNRDWIKSPPVHGRVVTVDYDNYVDNVIGPEFMKWATLDDIKVSAYDNEKRRNILWKNGSSLKFMTYMQKIEAHGGAALDVIYFDEEPTRSFWQENMMRAISTRGRMLLGMTAINGVTWTEDEIWKPGLGNSKRIYSIELTTYDNPINDKATIDKIKSMCIDQTEIDIRIYGKRKARGGNVYKMYQDKYPWVIEPFKIPESDGLLICAIDPHPQTAHAVLWVWVDFDHQFHPAFLEKSNCYCVAALFTQGHIPYLASRMNFIEAKIGRQHDICLCDPSAWNKDQSHIISKSVVDQLNEQGIYPIRGSKDLSGGLLKVAEMLSLEWTFEEHGILKRDFPQYMIFDSDEDKDEGLGRLRWELKNYRWPSMNLNSKKEIVKRDKPVDRDDHLVECHRRIAEYIYDKQYESYDVSDILFRNNRMVYKGQELLIPENVHEENWLEAGL